MGGKKQGEDTMKTKPWNERPKWAKPLNARLWRHVCESAWPPQRPTLAGVKRNRAGQIEYGIECIECEIIAREIGIE